MFKLKKKNEDANKCNNCIASKKPFGKNKEYCQLGREIGIDFWCCELPESEEEIRKIFEERKMYRVDLIFCDKDDKREFDK